MRLNKPRIFNEMFGLKGHASLTQPSVWWPWWNVGI